MVGAIRVAIVHKEYPNKKLGEEEASGIEERGIDALEKYIREANPSHIPRFYGFWRSGGYVNVSCADQESRDWLRGMVDTLEMPVKMVDPSELVKLRHAYVWVPGKPRDPEQVLQLIMKQTSKAAEGYWQVVSAKPKEGGQTITFQVDEETLGRLKEQQHTLFYGLRQLVLKVPEKGAEGGELEEEGMRGNSSSDEGNPN